PRPLVVSLHTWSGDYRQKDTLIHFCIHRGFHYIHPNFRGPNQNPEAMGSDKVVSDIDDAIDYLLKKCKCRYRKYPCNRSKWRRSSDSFDLHEVQTQNQEFFSLCRYL